ncbi:MAG: FAD-dependent oxidoreductase [Planctomycetia bacterium]|nr:FAD-dependent oxidoreductase [Planctomycetia bacterium]
MSFQNRKRSPNRLNHFLLLILAFLSGCWENNIVFSQYLKDIPNTIFLEAESFLDRGGWTLDNQYMDQMGSPVLLAHGWGTPVEPASTKVFFPKEGEYRVFVRTRNWVSPWTTEYAPGQFQLTVDNQKIETIFGTESADWAWQQGNNIVIDKSLLNREITIEINDLTGFDGRVDAICLTAQNDFVPPNDLQSLAPLRRQSQNLPQEIPDARSEPFDLVVVGGGLAGICSAISAARLGLDVALIQNRPVLGGNGSAEVRVHLNGNINKEPYPNLGNLTYLMGPHAGGNAREAAHYKDQERLELVQAEKSLTLFLNTQVNRADVEKKGDQQLITAIYGQNIETGKITRFKGHLFADCSGDGSLGFLAGADWRMGRESKSETNEAHAPEMADKMTMGASIQWNTVEEAEPSTFPVLPWAIQFNEETIRPMIHGDWDWETGMNLDQINDIERIRDNGLRAAYGHWSYMKNQMKGEWADRVKNRKLAWVSFLAGKRESRRLLGDVILKEEDLVDRTEWDDASVTTTWHIDLHYPEESNSKFFPNEEFRSIARYVNIYPYAIPYRCFYSRNVNNLFMAGRNISVTHIALGSIRVMRTGGMMGEVVGMAASLCRKNQCLPRDVYHQYLDELKELMRKGVAEPTRASLLQSRPDWLNDSGENLALKAQVAVSSLYPEVDYPAKFINDGKYDLNDNACRWVSSSEHSSHWVQLTFDHPTEINAFQVISGQAFAQTPIQDFVLQYEKEGKFVDIPETIVQNNESPTIALRFPAVRAKTFRLFITKTPGNLARVWELEFYAVK